MANEASPYLFRAATEADRPLLLRWRSLPHVVAWWDALEPDEDVLDDPAVTRWIVEHAGRPFAFAQDYSPHEWDDHPFAHLPPGARGIDQFIGEPDMLDQGHGSVRVQTRP